MQQQFQHIQNQQPYLSIPLTQQSLAQQQLLQQQQQQQQQHNNNPLPLLTQHNGRPLPPTPLPGQSGYASYTTIRNGSDNISVQQQQLQDSEHYPSVIQPHSHPQLPHEPQPTSNQYSNLLDPIQSQQLQQTKQAPLKQKSVSHYGQRFNPMYPSPASSAATPPLSHASLSPPETSESKAYHSSVNSHPPQADASVAASAVAAAARLVTRQSLTPQVSPHLNPARSSHDGLTPTWSPAAQASTSPLSTASMPAYLDTFELLFLFTVSKGSIDPGHILI
ncbi:hypothetical protein FBU30_005958 [Linnemannia zychae]|nr:hypothetical protein FBU30_005958 [Linnemannia zychae]